MRRQLRVVVIFLEYLSLLYAQLAVFSPATIACAQSATPLENQHATCDSTSAFRAIPVNLPNKLDSSELSRFAAMKKLLFTSLSTLVAASVGFPALAADLPSHKAPVVTAPPPMWTGFYAGLNVGYNFGTNSNVLSQNIGRKWLYTGYVNQGLGMEGVAAVAMDAAVNNNQSGIIGGGQIGYNYQYGSSFLLGIEADIQGAGIRGSSTGVGAARTSDIAEFPVLPWNSNTIGSTGVQSGLDWLGTVRGRIGYLWTPSLLLYGTGGFAYGGVYANVAQSAVENWTWAVGGAGFQAGETVLTNYWVGGGRQNQPLTGWTAGGGAEWMFMPNWSLKAEALYWDLGRMDVQTATFGVSGDLLIASNNIGWGLTSVSYQGVQAKVGVNYHFNWNAMPVVASY